MQQNQTGNQAETLEERYLQHALRLAEQQLTEQKDFFAKIAREAALHITLYVAAIAYLLSYLSDNQGDLSATSLTCAYIAMSTMAVASISAAFAAYTRKIWFSGAEPKYALNERFGFDFSTMAWNLLVTYQEGISCNEDLLKSRARYLNFSFWLGGAGVVTSFLLIVLVLL